jgi:hypothetical protein
MKRGDGRLIWDSPRERHPLLARVRTRGQEAEIESDIGGDDATNGEDDTDMGKGSGADRSCALPRIFLHGRGVVLSICFS